MKTIVVGYDETDPAQRSPRGPPISRMRSGRR